MTFYLHKWLDLEQNKKRVVTITLFRRGSNPCTQSKATPTLSHERLALTFLRTIFDLFTEQDCSAKR
jgi:hypothetical protein